MQDKVAVFMCNLKPAKMRGILSEAMIMCASTPEKVEILNVPQDSNIGDRVYAEGYSGKIDAYFLMAVRFIMKYVCIFK
jgi:tRNA-binding EMAP/Myf-like protein